MLIVLIALAAFIGGIVNALLGWTQGTQPFNPRKFISSAIASLTGAVVIATSFNYAGAESGGTLVNILLTLFVAFLSGAGVSAGASRISGSIGK